MVFEPIDILLFLACIAYTFIGWVIGRAFSLHRVFQLYKENFFNFEIGYYSTIVEALIGLAFLTIIVLPIILSICIPVQLITRM